jgi:adenosylmethionine-8-amino-7-oxononanoate aminotransferase
MNVSAAEKRYLACDEESEGIEVVRSDGSYLYDAKRKKYIDFMMGWCVGNVGWNNRAAKARIWSIEDSYHGNTLATLSIGASENRTTYRNLLPHCQKIEPPLDANGLDRIETRVKRRDVAAFIMEPIIINLGVCIPDDEFMTGLQRLGRRYGTLLVMDEVAMGFGRTRKLFATEHFGSEEYASKIGDRCRRAGLLFSAEDTSLLLLPALTIEPTSRKGLDILEARV